MIRHYPSCNPHHPLPVDAVSGENDPHNKINNTIYCIILIYKRRRELLVARSYTGNMSLSRKLLLLVYDSSCSINIMSCFLHCVSSLSLNFLNAMDVNIRVLFWSHNAFVLEIFVISSALLFQYSVQGIVVV